MNVLKKKMWIAMMLLSFILVLTACGGKTEQADGKQNQTSTEQKPAATKTVKTIHGDITIPTHPQRIVVDMYQNNLLALGIKPVGSVKYYLDNPFSRDLVQGITSIGDRDSVSFEKVLTLEPDLILIGSKDASQYENYSKIAPTVAIPYGTYKDVHEELTAFGELLGKEQEAKAWLAQYDQRMQAARDKLKGIIQPEDTFTVMEASTKEYYVYGDNFGRGGQAVYRGLGLTPPPFVQKELLGDTQWKSVSKEVINQYAGSYIFLTVNKETAGYTGDSIWKSLDAVRNGTVFELQEDRYWYFDPIAIVGQAEEIADMLVERNKEKTSQK
ncbi:ABC transporter (plasmid) [Paenibacillus sp. IHB B 3084]|uniref:ABC transporter substrate-binding protein n=1 Tax=Paenibacillus TaxID=44249 RepID=UPI00071FFC32|nr:ABC transporter substrate-binding protein [Paenibacillus sp. IHB B 3084]ALP39178.1 ABC transporter [Paenibacillus sp. IHB B 3084]